MALSLRAKGFSESCTWSYGGFMAFRKLVASTAGIDLDSMERYSGSSINISWDTVDTPLKPFLDHPDNEGTLSYQECGEVFPALLEAIESPIEQDTLTIR